MANQPVLYYFDGRGKAEIIRLTMAASGISWTPKILTERDQFTKLKDDGKLLFGQLPLVEYEGKNMVQSGSTTRYFARKGKLFGANSDDELKIDILFEGTRDFLSTYMSYGFDAPENVVTKAKTIANPKYLSVFERVLAENGANGHLYGSSLTLADIGLLEVLLLIEDYIGVNELNEYPNLQKFLTTIREVPAIKAYLSSQLRPRKNDERYIKEVRIVLNW